MGANRGDKSSLASRPRLLLPCPPRHQACVLFHCVDIAWPRVRSSPSRLSDRFEDFELPLAELRDVSVFLPESSTEYVGRLAGSEVQALTASDHTAAAVLTRAQFCLHSGLVWISSNSAVPPNSVVMCCCLV